ncbi:MAG: PEP-CTERM sorting domain-containing protein [Terriglobales bacterium]
MRKQAGVNLWGYKFVLVLLAASTAFLCQSASAIAVNCSHGQGRSCVAQSDVASDNSSGLRDRASSTNSFRPRTGDSELTGDNGMILPGPQSFKKQFGDVEFQTQLPSTQPLPEPSTIVLLTTGLLGIGISLRRIH